MVSLRIALRYLFSRKSHHAVNLISRISVAGVAVATAAIVCVLSVFNGFSRLASERLSHIDPELRVEPLIGKSIGRADSLAEVLMATGVVEAVSPVIEERALAMYGGVQLPVRIKGVADGYEAVTDISSIVIDGEFLTHDGDYGCATLSVGTAISLGAHPGYYEGLEIYVPRRVGRINPAAPMSAFRADTLLVGGVYEVDQSEYDADMVIVPLESARRLLDMPSQATALELRAAGGKSVAEVRDAVRKIVGPEMVVKDRFMQQEESFRMIEVEKWITFAMLAFILAIASFNVISTMSMLIIEKRDNIATLRALGAGPRMVRRIFMLEGWLIAIFGGVAGLVLGVILCLAQQWGGFIRLNGDPSQLSVNVYPVHVEAADLLAVAALVSVIGLVTGFVASRFSGRFFTAGSNEHN